MRDKKLKARTGGEKGRYPTRDRGLSRSWKAEEACIKKEVNRLRSSIPHPQTVFLVVS